MTKIELIRKLEGKIITTADGMDHVVKDGEFTTRSGALVHLVTLNRYHLEFFLKEAKE